MPLQCFKLSAFISEKLRYLTRFWSLFSSSIFSNVLLRFAFSITFSMAKKKKNTLLFVFQLSSFYLIYLHLKKKDSRVNYLKSAHVHLGPSVQLASPAPISLTRFCQAQ